ASLEHEQKIQGWTNYLNNGYAKVVGNDALTKAVSAAINDALPVSGPLQTILGTPGNVLRSGAIELAVRRSLTQAGSVIA
ncbi:MAG TPA: hypothetical protein VGP47_06515, partial [Parachlamydiaceae bacterium]|nr:hypothetical protein [Parachlamydiaceae bacterium]